MGISFRIDADAGIIHSRFEGEITLDQIKEHSLRLRHEVAFHPGLKELAEVADIRAKLSAEEMLAFTAWLRMQVPFNAIAVVCGDDLSFGMARMFATMMSGSYQRVEAFRDRELALRWLDEPTPAD
ncbi:MAG TPA: STAS/SEC14 domain-containing protein [bacterium]|jgi:hypothetical protein